MEIKEISLVEFLELLANGSKPKAFIYEKEYYWLNESQNRYESKRDYFDYIEIKNLNNKIQVILEPTPCQITQGKDDRKTTLLTLLEMHASGDFPKKIKIHNCVYAWDDEELDYYYRPSEDSDLHNKLYDNYWIFTSLNMEIEILDSKESDENNKSYDFEESN